MFKLFIFFSVGIGLGYFLTPLAGIDFSTPILLTIDLLLFLVGFSAAGNRDIFAQLKENKIEVLLIPTVSLLGSILGGMLAISLFPNPNYYHSSLISASMGYYSLPSVLVSTQLGAYLGTLLLLTNILREVFTLVFAPMLVKIFGKMAPIAAGGATTMDVTLPIITKSSGSDYMITSIINGAVLTVAVPVIISLLLAVIK